MLSCMSVTDLLFMLHIMFLILRHIAVLMDHYILVSIVIINTLFSSQDIIDGLRIRVIQ